MQKDEGGAGFKKKTEKLHCGEKQPEVLGYLSNASYVKTSAGIKSQLLKC